jgi:hypothetical protein
MKIKNFLKPNLLKIIITIILIAAFTYYSHWTYNSTMVDCTNSPCPEIGNPNYIINGIVSLIPFYLISCFINWIFKKFKY